MISFMQYRNHRHGRLPQQPRQRSSPTDLGRIPISISSSRYHQQSYHYNHYQHGIRKGSPLFWSSESMSNNGVTKRNRMLLMTSTGIRCTFVLIWLIILYYEYRTLISSSSLSKYHSIYRTLLQHRSYEATTGRSTAATNHHVITEARTSIQQRQQNKSMKQLLEYTNDEISARITPRNKDESSSLSLSQKETLELPRQQPPCGPYNNTKIPHVLIFTHYINLLTATFYNNTSESSSSSERDDELRTLQSNVRRIISLHSTDYDSAQSSSSRTNEDTDEITSVRFLTDSDCIHSIRQWAFISSLKNHTNILWSNSINNDTTTPTFDPDEIADELVSNFQKEDVGMYKADLCRGVALYETGGIYMDVDLGIRMNLFPLLQTNTEFVTVKVHFQSMYPGAFFQAFMACIPYHDVIHRYIQLFILYYRSKNNPDTTSIIESGPVGVLLLKRAYDEIQSEQQQLTLRNESVRTTLLSSSSNPPSSALSPFKTHLQQTTELWQELLYIPQFEKTIFKNVPRPTWGKRKRACNFVVLIPSSSQSLQEILLHSNTSDTIATPQLIVPMYSRIAGSRMCPYDDETTRIS